MRTPLRRGTRGFTLIELMLVIVLIVILAALVALTYSSVRSKNRNSERQADLSTLQAQLESYYTANSKYPTFANLSDAAWRKVNLKNLPADGLKDPSWSASITVCTAKGVAIPALKPTADCYSYEATDASGAVCLTTDCAHYTLTAVLEGESNYAKKSLN